MFDRFQVQVLPFVKLKDVVLLSWPEAFGH
ncbi:hypothetical protein GGQ13_002833 [Salinibacter ruber]|nr:hypothetical protein [Salinibacter ruber]